MKIQLRTWAFCLVLLCASTVVYAQDAAEAAFDEAAGKHKLEVRDLEQRRGVSLPAGLQHATAKSVSARLKEDFPENTVLLFYDYDEPVLRIWLVGAEGIRGFQSLNMSSLQLKTVVVDLRNSLGVDFPRSGERLRAPLNRGLRLAASEAPKPFNQAEQQLTQILMPPTIAGAAASAKHLIVVPVLEISAVPFALLRPFPVGSSGPFLIDRMSVSIAPSLFDVGQQMIRRGSEIEKKGELNWNARFQRPLVIGNPRPLKDSRWRFPSLPGAQSEAVEVARRLGVRKVLIGRSATRQALAAMVEDADLLYLATHGVASIENPLNESFLMLAAAKTDAGRWTAREIQDTRLNARLAVLSACSTGLGKHHAAGTIGLARAFQKSGVPRVVMSLWNVGDLATRDLMLLFIENLKSQIPAEALRQAMLQYRQRHPNAHPSRWAAFTLFGTPR